MISFKRYDLPVLEKLNNFRISYRALLTIFCASLIAPMFVHAHGPGLIKIRQLTQQIAEQGEQASLYIDRARIYQTNQHWQEAMADLDAAADTDPAHSGLDLLRADVTLASGEYLRALDFVERHLLSNKATIKALLIVARANRALGQHAAAAKAYQAALADLSTVDGTPLVDWYLEYADALVATGHKARALQVLEKGMAVIGVNSVFQSKAADLDVELGDYQTAVARIDSIAEQAQRKDVWLARRGDLLAKAGQNKKAQASYQQAYAALMGLPQHLRNKPASQALATTLQAHLATQ